MSALETLKDLRERIPDEAKDIRINLSSVLDPQNAGGLSAKQVAGVALASACATRDRSVVRSVRAFASEHLEEADVRAARAAAAVMAMNNVYYRFLRLVEDPAYGSLPARLRMSVVASPGVEKSDFELYALAVSAINGCGMCVKSHARKLEEAGFSKEAIQSAVRIASVIQAAAQAFFLADS